MLSMIACEECGCTREIVLMLAAEDDIADPICCMGPDVQAVLDALAAPGTAAELAGLDAAVAAFTAASR